MKQKLDLIMKKVIVTFIILVMSSHLAWARKYTYLMTDLRPATFKYMIDFNLRDQDRVMRLDCQSFIHELSVYKGKISYEDKEMTVILSYSECQNLADFFINEISSGEKLCFRFNSDTNEFSVQRDNICSSQKTLSLTQNLNSFILK